MIREKREYCRAVIAKEGFTVFHPACDEPWLDEEVEILYASSLNPCIIQSKEGDNYKYFILPIRLHS